jgi:hypothetical protein
MLPVLLLLAWRRRGRTSFYAWASLTVLGLTLLNSPYFGYAFVRPLHLQAVLPAVAIAAFLAQLRAPRLVLIGLVCLLAAYVQVYWWQVPHVAERRDLDPALVEYVRTLDGATVLVENAFHRDMDADLSRRTEATPFIAHAEALLAAETGKRLYAGLWDGWQWNVFRANLLAGGAFQSRSITAWPPGDLAAQLRKWGVKHAVVWSTDSTAFFSSQPMYARRWSHGRWTAFEFLEADPRDVAVPRGTGRLVARDWPKFVTKPAIESKMGLLGVVSPFSPTPGSADRDVVQTYPLATSDRACDHRSRCSCGPTTAIRTASATPIGRSSKPCARRMAPGSGSSVISVN